jgi:dihydrofolate reductase
VISLVAAVDNNFAIGRDGDLPWHIPQDLKLFKTETLGGFMIMGRRTWDSLPGKLPGRISCVVSRSATPEADVQCTSIEEALTIAATHPRVYGVGGAQIYKALMPHAHRVLLTHVDTSVPNADTFFPKLDKDLVCVHEFALPGTDNCVVREYLRT